MSFSFVCFCTDSAAPLCTLYTLLVCCVLASIYCCVQVSDCAKHCAIRFLHTAVQGKRCYANIAIKNFFVRAICFSNEFNTWYMLTTAVYTAVVIDVRSVVNMLLHQQ
jgi:hypothetical protein